MPDKIKSRKELRTVLSKLKSAGGKIVFTNGCFDLLHAGHVRYLQKAREQGDLLVVALNTDDSVRRIKGDGRPILNEDERCEVVSALACVDFVTTFHEETPHEIIRELLPDVLVKGGDWSIDRIVGRDTVEAAGGKVIAIDFEQGYSTSNIIDRIRRSPG
ncbi:MAG: D-glycero-beta-D-manno-heptose 1-phosphate adenylyltransferase [Acidobacteriota bacterium]